MRVVLDTNILISALLVETSTAAKLIVAWRLGAFTLVSSETQIDELARVTRYPKIRERLAPAIAGRLINQIREMAYCIDTLPPIDVSPDPYDNYLLAMAVTASADYLVTGDKQDLLALNRYEGTKIVSLREFLAFTRVLSA
ncbi:putative toxin-antitoxin system toxin component, PIN family [Imhoffiella purpurea]|uniref:PIN domain-containing protein n=1 Tax=Imhoffiella purpurea TaxID=1249627 RepID=W9VB51_9GAMM|nr:putative toxin-antitoxin system toxin component, PIN family [Imhoffiella purpurea]EXJ16669.1 hypothetical protein D779_3983 [Imhoffiella purpurea]